MISHLAPNFGIEKYKAQILDLIAELRKDYPPRLHAMSITSFTMRSYTDFRVIGWQMMVHCAWFIDGGATPPRLKHKLRAFREAVMGSKCPSMPSAWTRAVNQWRSGALVSVNPSVVFDGSVLDSVWPRFQDQEILPVSFPHLCAVVQDLIYVFDVWRPWRCSIRTYASNHWKIYINDFISFFLICFLPHYFDSRCFFCLSELHWTPDLFSLCPSKDVQSILIPKSF